MKRIEYSPISKGVVQSEGTSSRKQDPLSDRGGRENGEDTEDLDLEDQLVSALYLVQSKNDGRERARETSREPQRRCLCQKNQPDWKHYIIPLRKMEYYRKTLWLMIP